MAYRFATVSKGEILADETAAPTNSKKQTKLALSVFTGRQKKIIFTEFATKS